MDYYEVLGLSPTADSSQITTAYRRLALAHHPDKNKDDPNAALAFARINEAYRLLLDAEARAAFDKVRLVRQAAKERQKHTDSRRRALKEELLGREEEYRREREETERVEAERRLAREVSRVQAQAELKKKAEAGRSGDRVYSEEECTLRYTILGGRPDLPALFPFAKVSPSKADAGSGLLLFPDIARAREALANDTDGLILERISSDIDAPPDPPDPHNTTPYQLMDEAALEQFTIDRLNRLADCRHGPRRPA